MIRCNRRLKTIRAISLDLDDTLYANETIMHAAEHAQMHSLAGVFAEYGPITAKHWWATRERLIAQTPELQHDIGKLRLAALLQTLLDLGVPKNSANTLAQQAFDAFLDVRQRISIPSSILSNIATLAEHMPLVVISNGNADASKTDLAPYISASFHAGPDGMSKPHGDLFARCANYLNLAPAQILHVGDHPIADIEGAHRAGFATALTRQFPTPTTKQSSILADIEISDLAALQLLL